MLYNLFNSCFQRIKSQLSLTDIQSMLIKSQHQLRLCGLIFVHMVTGGHEHMDL